MCFKRALAFLRFFLILALPVSLRIFVQQKKQQIKYEHWHTHTHTHAHCAYTIGKRQRSGKTGKQITDHTAHLVFFVHSGVQMVQFLGKWKWIYIYFERVNYPLDSLYVFKTMLMDLNSETKRKESKTLDKNWIRNYQWKCNEIILILVKESVNFTLLFSPLFRFFSLYFTILYCYCPLVFSILLRFECVAHFCLLHCSYSSFSFHFFNNLLFHSF